MTSRSRKSFENLNFEAEIFENQRNFAHVKRLVPFPPYLGRGILRGQPLRSRKSFWKIGIWGGNVRKSEEFCTRILAPPYSRNSPELNTWIPEKYELCFPFDAEKCDHGVKFLRNWHNFSHVRLLHLLPNLGNSLKRTIFELSSYLRA